MFSAYTQSEYSYHSFSYCPDKTSLCSQSNLSLSVELQLCDEEGNNETELVPCVEPVITNDSILLNSVLDKLKTRGYSFKGAIISYYSVAYDLFIFCAIDPVSSYITIPLEDLMDQHLVLRVKLAQNECKKEPRGSRSKKSLRVRLRKIKEVIEKVTEWRRMNAGYMDDNGAYVKMTLLEAAELLSIPKKSLDDYLFLLRQGKQYGFDFNLYKNHTVGTLRSFINKHKVK